MTQRWNLITWTTILGACVFVADLAAAQSSRRLIRRTPNGFQGDLAVDQGRAAGPGKHIFTLKPNQRVGNKPVTAKMVSDILKAKLDMVTNITISGRQLQVAYTGTQADFLKKAARARIRSAGTVTIAAGASVSDGGIRAQGADRDPTAGEVKGTIIMKAGNTMTVKVEKSKHQGIQANALVKITGQGNFERGKKIFFKPTAKQNGVWQTSAISRQ